MAHDIDVAAGAIAAQARAQAFCGGGDSKDGQQGLLGRGEKDIEGKQRQDNSCGSEPDKPSRKLL